jgi:phytoene/squalene synthetase
VSQDSAVLARSITRSSSKQTYYTARLLVDRSLVDDFFRAYAYFRWVDDIVDATAASNEERISFIRHQRDLIECLYAKGQPSDLALPEQMLVDIINRDKKPDSRLQSFICNMFAIIEFDAYRKERRQAISLKELKWYTDCLGKSVTDGLQYFIGNGCSYPASDDRYQAAIAAHITHLLRDTVQDNAEGFINIPSEYLKEHNISPDDLTNPAFRAWVCKRVEKARKYFCQGKDYLDRLDVLRCKIAGYWYCFRLERILDKIENDDYVLRASYKKSSFLAWLKIVWLTARVSLKHITRCPSK